MTVIFGNEGYINLSGNWWTIQEIDGEHYDFETNPKKYYGAKNKSELIKMHKITNVHRIKDGYYANKSKDGLNYSNKRYYSGEINEEFVK